MPFGVANGSDRKSVFCGVPRKETRPSVAAAVPGVARPLAIGANELLGRAALPIVGSAVELFGFDDAHLLLAGLRPGPLPDGRADSTALVGLPLFVLPSELSPTSLAGGITSERWRRHFPLDSEGVAVG